MEMVVVDVANQAGDVGAEHRMMRIATEMTAVMMGLCVCDDSGENAFWQRRFVLLLFVVVTAEKLTLM